MGSTNGEMLVLSGLSGGGGGSGSVTSVSVVSANGVSGTVATATTTPAITLSVGANTQTVSQANTFAIGTCVSNINGTWTVADNVTAPHTDGTVTAIGNPFTVTLGGYQNTITGLAANTQYYLGTAGALTATAPTATNTFVVPVLKTGVAGDGVVEIGVPASNALINLVAISNATGSPSSTTYLRGDNSWATVTAGVTGTSLVNRQVAVASGASSITSASNFTCDTSGNLGANSLVTGNTVIGLFAPNLIGTNSGPLLLSSSNGHVLINTGSALGYVATTGNQGTFTLASGVATVSNTFIDANSIVVAWLKPGGKSGTITGPLYYPTTTAGVGFTVAETGGVTDNSTYNYIVVLINQ